MSVRLEQRKVDQTITMQTYKVDSMAPCSVRGVRNAIDSDRLPLTSYSLPHPEQTMSWTSKHSGLDGPVRSLYRQKGASGETYLSQAHERRREHVEIERKNIDEPNFNCSVHTARDTSCTLKREGRGDMTYLDTPATEAHDLLQRRFRRARLKLSRACLACPERASWS